MDETRLDAAPTPAHIFAYRAFRSVFITSPTSSPIKPQSQPPRHASHSHNNYHPDKENLSTNMHMDPNDPFPRSTSRQSRFLTSPAKSKSKSTSKFKRKDAGAFDMDIDMDMIGTDFAITLTPKRQKMVTISPAKSILKNPHAPTPRRAALRDATVTFKDLSLGLAKSVSPGGAKKTVAVAVPDQPDFSVVRRRESQAEHEQGKKHENYQIGSNKTNNTEVSCAKSMERVVTKVDSANQKGGSKGDATIVDLEEYKARAEKEIRRLIKYGQRWKELARRQEEDKEKTQAMLEDLQRENQRIAKQLAQYEATQRSIEKIAPTKQVDEHKGSRKVSAFRSGSHADRQGKSAQQQDVIAGESTMALQVRTDKAYGPGTAARVTESQSTRFNGVNTDFKKQIQAGKVNTFDVQLGEDPMVRSNSDFLSNKQTQILPGLEFNDHNIAKTKSPLRSVSDSVTLNEQRRAAARLRLDERRRTRTTSAFAASTAMKVVVPTTDTSKTDAEESQLDWFAVGNLK